MNTDPIFLPINTPIKQTKNVITPIDTQIGIISMFKKAKVTPTANASILVAIDKIINYLLSKYVELSLSSFLIASIIIFMPRKLSKKTAIQ